MAETLGSLCDKLTVVKLKQWHTTDPQRLESLTGQEAQLTDEINEFIGAAAAGAIPFDRLMFAANKVYASPQGAADAISGTIGEVVSRLAGVNCALWHEQEKVYEFGKIPPDRKDGVIQELARLNLDRNKCIEEIDRLVRDLIAGRSGIATT
jgi:hypothetical protein